MKMYRLSPTGRRTAIMLLASALLIWAFAVWSILSILQVGFSTSQGLGIGQLVPALLMLVLIIATPFLIWNLLEEWSATYTTNPDGLHFESLGVKVSVPWSLVAGLRPADDDGDEPMDEILLHQGVGSQITNPILRFLHHQAYGARQLPVYPGLEDRADLLNDVRRHAAAAAL